MERPHILGESLLDRNPWLVNVTPIVAGSAHATCESEIRGVWVSEVFMACFVYKDQQ